jgi:hypothetical protein
MKQKEQFMRTFFYNFTCPPQQINPIGREYWINYTDKNKKRILNRISDVFDNFANREHADNLLSVVNHMRTSYPLFDVKKYPPIILQNPREIYDDYLDVDRESYPESLRNNLNKRGLDARLRAYKLEKDYKKKQEMAKSIKQDTGVQDMNKILANMHKNNFSPEAREKRTEISKNEQEAGSIKKFFKSLLGL